MSWRRITSYNVCYTKLLRDVGQVADNLLDGADVVGTQALVLGGDPDGTAIQVADAQQLAAEHHQQRGAEAVELGAEQRRLDDVAADLEAAVGLQLHQLAQVVGLEALVGSYNFV